MQVTFNLVGNSTHRDISTPDGIRREWTMNCQLDGGGISANISTSVPANSELEARGIALSRFQEFLIGANRAAQHYQL
jgi:hypothetical protein